ncbi:MAG: hypothetical protein H6737_17950 [Alphaproteobacteria bacterium]|nr:hypothetical protein [Alphaproteobacteria bacterium]
MMRLAALLLLAGCPKQPAPPATPAWDTTPRLPAPIAGVYTRSAETPPDPPLADLLAGRAWDASLSGAAAGVALRLIHDGAKGPGVTRWRVREALWKSGYPFPARDARAWTAMPDGAPPPQLLQWLEALPPGDDLGLIRARGDDEDFWVALRATPTVPFERVPRQVPEGGAFKLAPAKGATYAVSDANGFLQEGPLDEGATIACNSVGEWMVELIPAEGPSALFPVYVGMVPPELPLIEDGVSVRTPPDAIERAESLLAQVRDAYGAPELQRDFVLDAGARSLLRGDAESTEGVRASLGLDPSGTMLWECEGTTVEACIDSVIWEPKNRLALLDARSALGLAAGVDASGVHLVGIVSATH